MKEKAKRQTEGREMKGSLRGATVLTLVSILLITHVALRSELLKSASFLLYFQPFLRPAILLLTQTVHSSHLHTYVHSPLLINPVRWLIRIEGGETRGEMDTKI